MADQGRTPSEPHPFDKDWLDCCKVCGEGIENQTPGLHVTPARTQTGARAGQDQR